MTLEEMKETEAKGKEKPKPSAINQALLRGIDKAKQRKGSAVSSMSGREAVMGSPGCITPVYWGGLSNGSSMTADGLG